MIRAAIVSVLACSLVAHAAVTNVEIKERGDVPVANFERIVARVHFAVDPKLPANKAIVDINLAPRDGKGLVEFSADLVILRPKNAAKSNGTLLLEVPNRGRTSLMRIGSGTSLNAMKIAEDIGDPLLLEQGFTLAFLGWQFDVVEVPGVLKLYAPVIKGVTGPVLNGIQVNSKSTSAALGGANAIPYPIADEASASLRVFDRPDGTRTEVPRSQWHFSKDGKRVEYAAGFEPGRLYEVVYTGKEPVPAGLGFAAMRDYVSYVKSNGDAKRAIGFGISQDGRVLRTFLYEGFNADESGKKVFDGVWAHIGGGRQGGFTNRFAQPSLGGSIVDALAPVDLPPFTTAELLAKSSKAGVAPKLILSNGSREYWGSNGSLVHTTVDGRTDVKAPENARVYYVAGTQHVTGGDGTGLAQYPLNTMEWRWFMRATMLNMNEWITKGTPPPPSRVPEVAKGELVAINALKFPKIPGITLPPGITRPKRLDFGPEFLTKGIIAYEPPKEGGPYTTLVPQVDVDGNETSGVRMPDLSVPLATFTGWNLRTPAIGAPGEVYGTVGATIAFPATRADRQKSGDPRLSIEERYRGEQDYGTRVETAARELVRERLVLERDVPQIVEQARRRWQSLMGASVSK